MRIWLWLGGGLAQLFAQLFHEENGIVSSASMPPGQDSGDSLSKP
jgi:hypothetical protein